MTQEEYNGKALLYVCNRSHENGYKEAVEKACKWLNDGGYFINSTETIEDFRKAMMEGRDNETVRKREEDNA